MIASAGLKGTLHIGSRVDLVYKDFTIHVRRCGRVGLGTRNRYGNPGPNGFLVLHESIRQTKPQDRSISGNVITEVVTPPNIVQHDQTDPAHLRKQHEAESHGLKHDGFSLRVIIPKSITDRCAELSINPTDFFDAVNNGSGYIDNMHSHNQHVIETLGDLIRRAKDSIEEVLTSIKTATRNERLLPQKVSS